MKARGFILLVAVTGLAVLAAQFVVRRGAVDDHPATQAALLFPGLKDTIATVTKIEIDTAGDVQTLERQGYEWTLPAKDHYPADQAHVAQLLSTIAMLTVIEEKTSDPARYADLTLAPPSQDPGAGREVKLLDDNGAVLADLIVGRIATSLGRSGGGVYVRRGDAAKAWLAEGSIDLPASLLDWTRRDIFDLSDHDAIKTATLKQGDATIVTVSRDKPQDDEFKLAPAPPGAPDQGKALRLALMPVALDFTDMRAVTPADKPARSAAFEGFDGTTYRLDIVTAGSETWAVAGETGPASAATFTERHKAWLYKLPPHRGELLQSDLAGFGVTPDAHGAGKGN